MPKLKIGVVGSGSGVRELVSEEESFSNAGLITGPIYQLLSEHFDPEFYIIGPVQKKVKDNIEKKTPDMWRDHLSRFTICDATNEPNDLDLIIIQSGRNDNLRIAGSYSGFDLPCIAFAFRALRKYSTTPVIYTQTDFAAPFHGIGELFDHVYRSLYPSAVLWKRRKLHVIAAGEGKNIYERYMWFYKIKSAVSLDFLPPDMHFLIDLDSLKKQYTRQPLSYLAFAGKQRGAGSRENIISNYLKSSINIKLAGKWKEDMINSFKAISPNFDYVGVLSTYYDVLDFYNKAGCSFYCSSEEYHEALTVTSRMYDAVHAKAVPFINESDFKVWSKQWGSFNDLCVNPNTFTSKFKYLEEHYDVANNIINLLYVNYKKNRESVVSQFKTLINSIIAEKGKYFTNVAEDLKSQYKMNLVSLKRNKPTTDDEISKRINDFMGYDTTKNLMDKNVMASKMQLGLFYDYNSRESFDDVPKERINDALDFLRVEL